MVNYDIYKFELCIFLCLAYSGRDSPLPRLFAWRAWKIPGPLPALSRFERLPTPSPLMPSSALRPAQRSPKARRNLMLLGIFVASLPTTAVVLAFPGGNLWVESSWRQFRAEWTGKGEVFDPEPLVGPEIPDAGNFARAPLIAELYRRDQEAVAAREAGQPVEQGQPAELEAFSVFRSGEARPARPAPPLSYLSGAPVDLALYLPAAARPGDNASAAAHFLALFDSREETLSALMEASRLPGARYPFDPVRLRSNRLSHAPALIQALHSLRLYLIALIEPGDGDGETSSRLAAERVAGALRVIRLGTASPGLASCSIQIAALESAGLEPVWHALKEGRLDDAEWAAIDRELRAFDLGKRLLEALRFERAVLVRDQESVFARRSARPFALPPAWVRLADLKEYADLTQRYWFTDPAGGGLLSDAPLLPRLAAVEDLTRDIVPTAENLLVAT